MRMLLRMQRTTQADHLIARFGGIGPMARALGLARSVVQGWRERGSIPSRRYTAILEAGHNLDPPLTQLEFLQQPDGVPHVMRRSEAA
jgi:hypothetical protein